MVQHRGECLVYLRGERIGAGRISLKVSGREHEWTEAGRQDFASDAPATIFAEVTVAASRRVRHTSVHEYRQPPQPCAANRTPGGCPRADGG